MRIIKTIIVLIIFIQPLHAADKWLIIGQSTFAASVAADLYSGARLPRGEFVEVGPTGSNRAIQVGLYAGSGALVWYATGKIWEHGGKRNKAIALAILAGGSVAHGWAAGHNFKLR